MAFFLMVLVVSFYHKKLLSIHDMLSFPFITDITQAVGNTPCVKINSALAPPGRTIYVKCEFFNPLSSVKDRLAVSIIETAEKEGKLKPGDTVIEATSGNTGSYKQPFTPVFESNYFIRWAGSQRLIFGVSSEDS